MKKIFTILIIILFSFNSFAVEREADKTDLIKKLFKGKKFEDTYHPKLTKKQNIYIKQLLKDFINQNGIEMIEPIAVGDNINSPEIAALNKACSNKKPINETRQAYPAGHTIEQLTEEELDPPANELFTLNIQNCLSNMKIYKANIYNEKEESNSHVLYCEEYDSDEIRNIRDDDNFTFRAIYLAFNPNICKFPTELQDVHPKRLGSISGLFKYKNTIYLYYIKRGWREKGKKNDLDIVIKQFNDQQEIKMFLVFRTTD